MTKYKSVDLTEHSAYESMLNALEKVTKQIEYVLVDDDDTRLPDKFSADVIFKKQVKKWWGTVTSQTCTLYRLYATPALFKYLKRFETFCRLVPTDLDDCPEQTDFGINDIAFFDGKAEPILFTVTHEGYIECRNDFLPKL